MREILFKAKSTDNGEWVEGLLIIMFGQHHIQKWRSENIAYSIDPKTICQYTGLTDKNGKWILENDILRGHGNDKDLSKVAFGEFGVIDAETLSIVDNVIGWHYEPISTDALSKCYPFCSPMPLTNYYIDRCEFEVIGNIFDNPELLEEEEDE
ncbi:MAG: YopX family protein [Anaerostipes sp.]|uniref:YopX family protein n=1 Tax=Anaerostipes sp. TaxID=1872530 RepID=UPI003992D2DA